jgi:hypothetical protein
VGLVRGRRYGNVVIAGRRPPGRLPVDRITRRTDAMVLHGPELDDFAAGARPLTDAEVTV